MRHSSQDFSDSLLEGLTEAFYGDDIIEGHPFEGVINALKELNFEVSTYTQDDLDAANDNDDEMFANYFCASLVETFTDEESGSIDVDFTVSTEYDHEIHDDARFLVGIEADYDNNELLTLDTIRTIAKRATKLNDIVSKILAAN